VAAAPQRLDVGQLIGPAAAQHLCELAGDLLATMDSSGHFTSLNPSWERVLGWSRSELLGTRAVDLVHAEDLESTMGLRQNNLRDVAEFENRYRCRDGSYRWLQWNATKRDGTWYAVAHDVTGSRLLERQALRDPLTGLANRTAATERLACALRRLERHPALVGVLFVDLDHFKVVNDGRGHEIGDRLLRAAAARLRETVRGIDVVARLGGDEFVVIAEGAAAAAHVIDMAERIVAALGQSMVLDGEELCVGASVGVAISASSETTPESLLREADIAMYQAKAHGGGRYAVFDDALREVVEERVRVGRELSVAVDEGSFEVLYQPIVSLPAASVSRCEALVRWRHPTRGLLVPGMFLPSAEESGLIVRIGELVLREACRQTRRWRNDGLHVAVTVNVSTRQLDEPNFPELVSAVLREARLPPAALTLEITETAIMSNIDRVAPGLEALRRVGVQIAMDDFGSGYSSLRYLRLLPLDVIKVDRSFVSGIVEDRQDRAVVAGIIMLGQQTSREVIAEGVETDALHEELIRLGCELAQGYLYDIPRPAAELSLTGYSSRVRRGLGDPLVIREFMRQIGIPARIGP
jgi:diguanylate cyclase (GGDEF)-like protein/PAS domain S-box-containing protein